ncbi:MAG: cofactor-independent phosphoglycerate mutase [Ruminococcaceae bacterium]|nr:cofactor-independent phosphoglycerate mutase [Oscillospiraceae bacterium]
MKYVVFLGDGMADFACNALGGKTPLECANKPNMDMIAKKGSLGLAKTVDDTLSPGSDVANLSVLGYDPLVYYSGRSPLEALSIGVDLQATDVTFRANLVTLSDEGDYSQKTMVDYSAGEVSTQEAVELITYLQKELVIPGFSLYSGISYRHLLVWDNGSLNVKLTPPHDISKKKVTDYLPGGEAGDVLLDIMKKSHMLLKNHPINQERIRRGKNPANSLWIWGEGTKPALDSFKEKYGLSGCMISAVDLLKGIGNGTGMQVATVAGATGNIDTNFEGKAEAAIKAFESGCEFVYIHVEAPDECGHQGQIEQKVKAIELIDEKIVGPVMNYLENSGEDYAVLLTPDHPTPLCVMTHVKDPVPFAIYKKGQKEASKLSYTEANAKKTGLFVEKGCELIKMLLNK